MTPQERQLVNDLFDRLAKLETGPRDADAERAIAEGLKRVPNALYPLVQTVLVQDEALKRADARIRELSGADQSPAGGGGFLDNMRNALGGHGAGTSVPSVRAATANEPDPRWNSGGAVAAAPPAQPAAPGSSGGSFLGTAAASAAGVIGGALLFSSISSLFGNRGGGSSFGDVPPANGASPESPWDNKASGSDLAREAGLNDIGVAGNDRSAGLFDSNDADSADFADLGGDFGGGDSA